MKTKKALVCIGLLTGMIVFFTLTSQVLAGGIGIEPPQPGAVITGPEIWGVVVISCTGGPTNNFAIIRIKYVSECNVYTQALKDLSWTGDCPADSTAVEGQGLAVGTQFLDPTGAPYPGTPFITKVKNFRPEPDGLMVSFDAQFKFFTNP